MLVIIFLIGLKKNFIEIKKRKVLYKTHYETQICDFYLLIKANKINKIKLQ